MCEQFNSKIVKYRGKPIITMLKEIRLYIIGKVKDQRALISKSKGSLCPKIHDKLETAKKESGKRLPIWMGDPDESKFEVECKPQKYIVNLKESACSCRQWDLTGVPCVHAIVTLGWGNKRPEDYAHEYLRLDTFAKAYEPLIQLVNGPNLWPDIGMEPIQPPNIKKPTGRPKKQRRKDPIEKEITHNGDGKLKRRLIPTCSKCKMKGHNKRSCKGPSAKDHAAATSKGNSGSQQPTASTRNEGSKAVASGSNRG